MGISDTGRLERDGGESRLIREYIERECGIYLTNDKTYLVQTRLTALMVEQGCRTFNELYFKAVSDCTYSLRDKIIDAMTTNETLWFRDTAPFQVLNETLLDEYAERIRSGRQKKLRIWSAACSTGQEPYSIAITVLNYLKNRPRFTTGEIEILATDISPSALFLAKAGRYDWLAIDRGLPGEIRDAWFRSEGNVWVLDKRVRNMVTFKKFNLQESFASIGRQDIVFCRNVLIYFADAFKRDILERLARLTGPDGYLILGATESIINSLDKFQLIRYDKAVYYKSKH